MKAPPAQREPAAALAMAPVTATPAEAFEASLAHAVNSVPEDVWSATPPASSTRTTLERVLLELEAAKDAHQAALEDLETAHRELSFSAGRVCAAKATLQVYLAGGAGERDGSKSRTAADKGGAEHP